MAVIVTERFVCLGINEEIDTCDCCGKSGLKKTIIMAVRCVETGETDVVAHYGCVCAAKHCGLPAGKMKVIAQKAEEDRLENAIEEAAKVVATEIEKLQMPTPIFIWDETKKYGLLEADGVSVFSYHKDLLSIGKKWELGERKRCWERNWKMKQATSIKTVMPSWAKIEQKRWDWEVANKACD